MAFLYHESSRIAGCAGFKTVESFLNAGISMSKSVRPNSSPIPTGPVVSTATTSWCNAVGCADLITSIIGRTCSDASSGAAAPMLVQLPPLAPLPSPSPPTRAVTRAGKAAPTTKSLA